MRQDLKIPASEFKERRQATFDRMSPGELLILLGAPLQYRNDNVEYPFRQESHFYYLTGFCVPQAIMILSKNKPGEESFILFYPPQTPEEASWTGKQPSFGEVKSDLEASDVFPLDSFAKKISAFIQASDTVYYSETALRTVSTAPEMTSILLTLKQALQHKHLKNPGLLLTALREIKSPNEIQLMQRAANISVQAHLSVMRFCRPHLRESALEGQFIASCFEQGAHALAYSSIVAGGENACTLHYTKNKDKLKEGDLVLVDAGAEYEYYASDITRTYPVNGRFTSSQRLIYELVLKAQTETLALVKPGLKWEEMQAKVISILVTGLVEAGLLKGSLEALIEQKAYRKFYMHSSSHFLGLDVHDVGEYKSRNQSCQLKPGMVLTMEPGIYISKGDPEVPQEFWGLGVRIEDDVLVTEAGAEVLTGDLPKSIEALEEFVQK